MANDSYRKISDGLHEYRDLNGRLACCHLLVYKCDGKPLLVIASEIPDNPGQSVTNAAEAIATSIAHTFVVPTEGLRVIERYPKDGEKWYEQERYTEVHFSSVGEEFAGATFQHITKEGVLAIVENGASC